MQTTEEDGVGRDGDAVHRQLLAHGAVVQKISQKTRVDVARIAAAGATVKCAGIGIVDHIRPMTADQHEAAETFRERHGLQHRFGDHGAGLQSNIGRKVRLGGIRPLALVEAETVADQLAGIDRTHRFDKGEGGNGGQLEPSPGAGGPGAEPRLPIGIAVVICRAAAEDGGLQENRQTMFGDV